MKQHQNPYKFTTFDKRRLTDENQVKTNFNFLVRTGLIMEPIPSIGQKKSDLRIPRKHSCNSPNNLVEFAAQLANS